MVYHKTISKMAGNQLLMLMGVILKVAFSVQVSYSHRLKQ